MNKLLLIVFFFLYSLTLWCNQDSLWSVYDNPKTKPDVKVSTLNELAWSYMFTNTDSAFIVGEMMLEQAKKTGKDKHKSSAYSSLGIASSISGNFQDAIDYYHLVMKFDLKSSDLIGVAGAYSNMGIAYMEMGNDQKAISSYLQSLKLLEAIFDTIAEAKKDNIKSRMASCNTNIGLVYFGLKEFDTAEKHYKYSLNIYRKLKQKDRVANVLTNYAMLFFEWKKLKKSKLYHEQALELRIEVGDIYGQATSYEGIGIVSMAMQNYDEAQDYFNQSLTLFKKVGDVVGVSKAKIGLANISLNENKYSIALPQCEEAYSLAKKAEALSILSDACECLHAGYKELGQPKKALVYYEEHILLRDSLINQERIKDIFKQSFQFEYEKQKAIDDAQHDKEIAIKQQEKEKQKILTTAVAVGLVLVILFLIFVFNRLRITKKQKFVIEEQKGVVEVAHHELEEKNQEIMDSITYAKRIQSAILPPPKVVKEYLQESFIIYKPKDIVAGDFYWMESVPINKDNIILFAAADCTGHGVPGAMVSVVCNNALNRSVREHGLTDPGKILDKTREIVIQEFEKSDEEVKDGMDIALCSLEGNTLKYAGANNPLWIIRNNEIIETKANKQPIGKFDNPLPFTTHTFELLEGDAFYVFSDGYVDQFGGIKGKKFKAKSFRELLLSIQDKSMEVQKKYIDETFETWKGDLEQIDDVCVIGVRV
jgi:serine phosphatase RsbU (regulator of sigma subunit)/Tfp pilus assembly protein PilF